MGPISKLDLAEQRTLDEVRIRADALIRLSPNDPARWPGYSAVAQAYESVTGRAIAERVPSVTESRDERDERLFNEGRDSYESYAEQKREEREPAFVPHTVRGVPIGPEGVPYGTTHDFDCQGIGCKDTSFTASPRSETYWSS